MRFSVVLVYLAALFALASAQQPQLSTEACRERGFTSTLQCSTCDKLKSLLEGGGDTASVQALDKDCRDCCYPVLKINIGRYDTAKLVLCRSDVMRKQDLREFVEEDMPKYKGKVAVSFQPGTKATLEMYDASPSGVPVESFRIGKWNRDAIKSYLSSALQFPVS